MPPEGGLVDPNDEDSGVDSLNVKPSRERTGPNPDRGRPIG